MFNKCSCKTSEGCNVDFQLRGKRNVYMLMIFLFFRYSRYVRIVKFNYLGFKWAIFKEEYAFTTAI